MLVLLVEDDPYARDIYRTILRVNGFEVVETADGEEAVRLAKEHGPDIVLMDMGIQGCDGWEATRRLKEQEETAGTPVVALTGHVMPEHRARAAEVGCDAFLAKPVEPAVVIVEMLRLLVPPTRR